MANTPPWNKLSRFQRTLNITDFGVTANITMAPSTWNKVGSYTVPAQTYATFGYNDPTGGASAAGASTYFRLDKTTPTDFTMEGAVRFAIANASETNVIICKEERTEKLKASQYDRTLAVLFPEYPIKAREDSKLIIYHKMDSATALTAAYAGSSTKY
jgi:hypothetical protein